MKNISYETRQITDIKDMITKSAAEFADRNAYFVKDNLDSPYRPITYRQAYADINAVGTSLCEKGLKGKKIAIIGDNRYEWAISYMAVICGTGIAVPIDKELKKEEIAYLILHSEAEAVIFSNRYKEIFEEIKKSKETNLKILIEMEGNTGIALEIAKGNTLLAEGNNKFVDATVDKDAMNVLMYTSGTTGMAKGVMLSHTNLAEDLMRMVNHVALYHMYDTFFSILPIHHAYESTCGILMPFYCGSSVAFCDGLKYIAKNLQEVKPTVFLGVPLLLESMHKKIWAQAKSTGADKKLKVIIRLNTQLQKVKINIAPLLLKKILDVFGGNMRLFVSGGAYINPQILDDLRGFGINAIQGYGLTECAPILAVNPDYAPISASAGVPIPGIDVKIFEPDENGMGEIIAKGKTIMLGYYKNPEATEEVIKDGWFHTGDIGYMDKDNYIFITGRKKNVIITKNGKNVFPEELEAQLLMSPLIAECVVKAAGKGLEEYAITAEVLPDMDEVKIEIGDSYTEDELTKKIWECIDQINEKVPTYKTIKRLELRDTEFEKTTTKKIKRK